MNLAIIYFALIAAAETLTTLWNPRSGVVLHIMALLALLFHGAVSRQTSQRRFLLTLTLAPLIRILSVSLPLSGLPLTGWYISIGSLLFIAVFVTASVTRMKANRLGLRVQSWKAELSIALIGPGLGFLEFFILQPSPLIERLGWDTFWLPALSLLIFTGFLEEVIFRGLIQEASTEHLGRFGLVYGALIFAVLHMGYLSVVDVLFVFGVGLMFGLIVTRTRSLVGVSLAHGLTNISMYLIYPFLLGNLFASSMPSTLPEMLAPRQPVPHFPGYYSTATPTTEVVVLSPLPPLQRASPTPFQAPSLVIAVPTAVPCGPPSDWVPYVVRPGDDLETLSRSYGVSVELLRQANCLDASSQIQVEQTLFVPPWQP